MISLRIGGIIVAAFIAGAFVTSPELRAYAAATIGSADIIDNSIQSVDIKNGQVKTADLGGGAVNSAKIADGTITYADTSLSFVKIEHRDDCNCGGTGWDPNGTSIVGFIYDDAITINSVVSVTMTKTSIMCTANHWTDGVAQILCNQTIAGGTGINYAIFNK